MVRNYFIEWLGKSLKQKIDKVIVPGTFAPVKNFIFDPSRAIENLEEPNLL